MGLMVLVAPSADNWVQFVDQLLGTSRNLSPGSPTNLVLEVVDRFLAWDRVQLAGAGLTADPVGRELQGTLSPLDLVAQELEAMGYMGDSSLFGMKRHSQLFQDLAGSSQGSLGLSPGPTSYYPVVCPTGELVPFPTHLPVKRSEKDVAQERRYDRALRSTHRGGYGVASDVASGFQHTLNERKDSAV